MFWLITYMNMGLISRNSNLKTRKQNETLHKPINDIKRSIR